MSDESPSKKSSPAREELEAKYIFPAVYDELRRLASMHLQNEKSGHTLQPTALVNEAFLRLRGVDGNAVFANRSSFFAAAAEAMRRILVDSARRRLALKRGSGHSRDDIDIDLILNQSPAEVIAIDEAVDALAVHDAQSAELVKLRYFSGFSMEECAEILEISRATAYQWWTYAKAFLKSELEDH
ncbi:MAG: sigma-70 family RNA polymerase sigma factor [Planctomyces sp.]|nr:sigma-70 family RNA polymerase sigma factor [Planctomyces sp.]